MKLSRLCAFIPYVLAEIVCASPTFDSTIIGTISCPANIDRVSASSSYGMVTSNDLTNPATITVFNPQTLSINGSFSGEPFVTSSIAINGTLGMVADFNGSQIWTCDLVNLNFLGSCSVLGQPNDYTFVDSSTLIGANIASNTVNKIDVSDPLMPQISGTIQLEYISRGPVGVAIANNLGVACGRNASNLIVFSTSEPKILGTVSVPLPWDVATNGSVWAVTANTSTGRLCIVDPLNLQVTATISGLNAPRGVAVNDTQIVVANTNGSNLRIYQASAPYALQSTVPLGSGSRPYYVALNGTTAYVSVFNQAKINIVDTSSGQIIGTLTGFDNPYDVSLDGANMVVTQSPSILDATKSDYVSFFSISPGSATFLGSVSLGVRAGPRLATLEDNIAAVSMANNDCVNLFDISTRTLSGTISPLASAFGQASDGLTWVCTNQAEPSIAFYDPITKAVTDRLFLNAGAWGAYNNGVKAAVPLSSYGIQFVDIASMQLLSKLALPLPPSAMSVSGSKGAVALRNSESVMIFDMNKESLLFDLNVDRPFDVSLNKNILIVASQKTASVQIFDLFTQQKLDEIPVAKPNVVSIDGTRGFVTDASTNQVVAFTLPMPALPTTYTITSNGVASTFNNAISSGVYDPASGAIYDLLFDVLIGPNVNKQAKILSSLAPQFKILQYAQEKLDLLLHKELDQFLYNSSKDTQVFALGGYDRLKQAQSHGFIGYSVDNYYQLLGASKYFSTCRGLFALGASESYLKTNPYKSHAHYPTAWGSLGVSSINRHFIYGASALFGYSFVKTSRNVSLIDAKAKSSHGLWNISFDAKLGYKVDAGKVVLTPYDNFGYLYGHENNYHEKGAPGDNFFVNNEYIALFRNQLGLKLKGPRQYEGLNVFVDGSYVYEHYLNTTRYRAKLEGSNITTSFYQMLPAKNYGRIQAGFEGVHKGFEWRVSYTGLYGKNLADSAVSFNIGGKF